MKSVATLILLTGQCCFAHASPFQNGSFELINSVPPITGSCRAFNAVTGSTQITGWTVSVGNVDWRGAPIRGCFWTPSDGSVSLGLVGLGGGGVGGIEQTFDTVPGKTYVVAFDLAGDIAAPPIVKPLAVTIDGATTIFTFDTTGRSIIDMGWTTHGIRFTAIGTSSTIRFVSDVTTSGGTLDAGAALDNVQITLHPDDAIAGIPLDCGHTGAPA